MAAARALTLTTRLAQWISLFGLLLAGFGLLGWILSLFHRASLFLIDLGLLALPFIFLGVVLFLIAALLQSFRARRS
ncbi:MAG: hypothetical protein WBD46_15790 [Acidobacteriaceae bacterium]